jgi:uncharacterized protein
MILPIVLLVISNAFMTYAWYGHLKHTSRALWLTVLISWGIAFFEYCFQVPANRIGYENGISASQLKIIAEVLSLTTFFIFAYFYLGEPIKWNYLVSMGLIFLAVVFAFAFN